MKKTLLLKTMLLLCAIIVGSSSAYAADAIASGTYKRVTNVSELTAGSKVLFVSEANNTAAGLLSTTSAKYRESVSITISSHTTTIASTANVVEFTVGGNSSGFTFHDGNGYINSTASTGANLNNTGSATDNKSKWTVTISSGVATINNNGNTSRYIKYNSSSPRFACYASSFDGPICIYIKEEATDYALTYAASPVEGGTVSVKKSGTDVASGADITSGTSLDIVATNNDGYAFAGWTATAGTIGNADNATTTFTMPSEAATLTANFKKLCAVTFTASSAEGNISVKNGDDVVTSGDKVLEGTILTIKAEAGANKDFASWNITGASPADASAAETTLTVGTDDITVAATFIEIPTHTVTWSVNGTETSIDVAEGTVITFPVDPADLDGKTFMGWTETAIAGTTDVAPTFVTSATMGTSDLKYYAVFATGTGSPATLTKMASDETLSDGDKIVIVANDGTTEYALYQKESKTTYIDKYVFDGQVETVAADDLNWVTANAEADEKWSFGDATNGYIYNSSKNEFKIDKSNKTSFTVAFNSDNNGFTIKNGSRWFAYRADLTEANQLFRGAGNSTTPTDGSVAYFDIYKYVAGNANYSGYCTSVNATATIPANKEWITFCSTANLDFTSDITGLEGAYTITAHADKAITLTATKMEGKVKAGTGLLLRAKTVSATDAQVINIPVAATGEEQADNMLKGVTEDTEIAPTTGEYTNLGLKDGEFHPYTNGPSDMAKLKAGKAYLQVPTAQMPTGGNNARLYIVLDGEATGINAIENSELRIENLDAPMYNLAGQRVTKSYKGVVIVNGKKYINK